jgi:hypothetical protein
MTAPNRIWAWKSEAGGLRSQDWTADEDLGPRIGCPSYTRRDPAALEADPLVQALIGALVEEAAAYHNHEIARLQQQIAENDAYLARRPVSVTQASEANEHCRSKIYTHTLYLANIRALRPDANAALQRMLREAENRGIEKAAKKAEDFSWDLPIFADATINEVTDDVACEIQRQAGIAIRTLKEKQE